MHPLLKLAAGALVGATAGYIMYRFVGCRTGACPLTANPYTSTLIYAILGALLFVGK